LQGEANPVVSEDLTTVLALLDERRDNVITQRTRLINQLHALLRDLLPGGAPVNLTAQAASTLLATVRTAGPVEAARKQLARDLITEIRDADQRLKTLTNTIAATVAEHGSQLPTVEGIGPVIAGRLLGRTRRASRFPHASAFANYAGVAPVEVASAQRARHRLPRGGDRQLNLALHLIARTQVRMPASQGRTYYDTKIAEGKTPNEALRCLKRRLADRVWRIMIADERRLAASPGGHPGATMQSSAAGSTPTTSSSDKSLPGPTGGNSTTPHRRLDKHRGTPGFVHTFGVGKDVAMPSKYDEQIREKAVRLVRDHAEGLPDGVGCDQGRVWPAGDERRDAAEVVAAG
jgi:transposase